MTHLGFDILILVSFMRIQAEYINVADVPCGRSERRREVGERQEARIVGGQDATPHEFPWLVSIKKRDQHFCGGIILNNKFVLTAGHCLCVVTARTRRRTLPLCSKCCASRLLPSLLAISLRGAYASRPVVYSRIFENTVLPISYTWIPYEEIKERARNTVFSFNHDFYDTRIKIFIGSGGEKVENIGKFHVTLGEHDLSAPEVPVARHVRVINAVLHPGHRCGEFVNDIGLLEFATPISWSKSVKPACLSVATGNSAFDGVETVVAGWGWLGENRTKCEQDGECAAESGVRIVPNTVCTEWYASRNKLINLSTKQMCAGWEQGEKDSCFADSGGPLMVRSHPAKPWIVNGVVSAGIGCARLRMPGIYEKVSDHVFWITQEVRRSYARSLVDKF